MNQNKFIDKYDIGKKTEIEKVEFLAYFMSKGNKSFEFTINDCVEWLVSSGFANPNKSRLKKSMISSRSIVKGRKPDTFKVCHTRFKHIDDTIDLYSLSDESIDNVDSNTIIPESLYKTTRKYIELLSKQINASYDNAIFDGCAVLMRRLFEILLIHSYEYHHIDIVIKDVSGNYKMLSEIVADAKSNTILNLSRNTKNSLEKIRDTGNYAAHKIFYNTKKSDIDIIRLEFRAVVEELLYKSGIRS